MLLVRDLPAHICGRNDLRKLLVTINYTGDGNVEKAIVLDHAVVPLFQASAELLELARTVAAGNSEFETLEETARAIIEKIESAAV